MSKEICNGTVILTMEVNIHHCLSWVAEPRYGTSAPTAASPKGDVALREQQEALERYAKQRNSSMAAAAAADASASSAYDHFPLWQDPGTENDEEVARRLQADLDASTLQDELIARRMQVCDVVKHFAKSHVHMVQMEPSSPRCS